MKTITLTTKCTGPNSACRKAHRAGRSVHVIPEHSRTAPALIMPTNHYHSEEEAVREIALAELVAPTVRTDADLVTYREQNVAHFLPVGWVDPSRRKADVR